MRRAQRVTMTAIGPSFRQASISGRLRRVVSVELAGRVRRNASSRQVATPIARVRSRDASANSASRRHRRHHGLQVAYCPAILEPLRRTMKTSALFLSLLCSSACAHGGGHQARSPIAPTVASAPKVSASNQDPRIEVSHRYVLSGGKDAELIVVSADPEQPPASADNSK